MDPLAILKEFCVNGQLDQVVIEEDRIKFGDKYSFPKQSPTAFKSKVCCMVWDEQLGLLQALDTFLLLLSQLVQPLWCHVNAAFASVQLSSATVLLAPHCCCMG
jgi:hypothetical protein